jgi:hypothetical protein
VQQLLVSRYSKEGKRRLSTSSVLQVATHASAIALSQQHLLPSGRRLAREPPRNSGSFTSESRVITPLTPSRDRRPLREHRRPLCRRFSNGPGRDRTYDLGIKSSAGIAATLAFSRKVLHVGQVRSCNELRNVAADGDAPVLRAVLPGSRLGEPESELIRCPLRQHEPLPFGGAAGIPITRMRSRCAKG